MFGKVKKMILAAVVAATSLFATGVAMAQESPLVTAATTATAASKTELLVVAGLLFVVTLALWGAYKIIRMFGSR